jgi:hypothetical protein
MLGAIFAAQTVAPNSGIDAVTAPQTVKGGTDAITVPHFINYQGKLTDADGVPLPNPTYDLTFSIWDVPTGGVTPLWTETQLAVPVTNGLFSVVLGMVTPIPTTAIPDAGVAWLQTAVGSTVMSPRAQLAAAPYAYSANNAHLLEGNLASAFTTPATDAGRSGAAANLYEGTSTLASKYAPIAHTHNASTDLTGTAPVTVGGTGTSTAPTQYGVIYANTAAQYASTGAGASGYPLVSNATSAPTYQQLNTAGIAANAVSQCQQTYGLATYTSYSISNSWSSPFTFQQSITTNGGSVLVIVNTGGWAQASASSGPLPLDIELLRDGTAIAQNEGPAVYNNAQGGAILTLNYVDPTPAAGPHVYSVKFQCPAGSYSFYQNYPNNTTLKGTNSIICIELKK